MRPLMARAVSEHEALAAEAGAGRYLRHTGWLKLYRTDRAFAGQSRELDLAAQLGIANVPLDRDAARALEPSLKPVFRHAVHWTGAVSVSNPLAVTRAYAARFAALGGLSFTGDARTLHRAQSLWRVDTAAGPLDAGDVVIALGPWLPDLLDPLGIKPVSYTHLDVYKRQGLIAGTVPTKGSENFLRSSGSTIVEAVLQAITTRSGWFASINLATRSTTRAISAGSSRLP